MGGWQNMLAAALRAFAAFLQYLRARRAAATVRGLGHQRVHVLQGGMAGWRAAGLPVEKSA